jgi:hypothetical protein
VVQVFAEKIKHSQSEGRTFKNSRIPEEAIKFSSEFVLLIVAKTFRNKRVKYYYRTNKYHLIVEYKTMKFTASAVFLGLIGNIDPSSSFSIQAGFPKSSGSKSFSSALSATVEKTKALIPPSEIPDDDIPGLFEKYVQKTYG